MNKLSKFEQYLVTEIGIEFKATLYFFCILFFESMYYLYKGANSIPIPIIIEMILACYFMGYVQVYLFNNFDEADRLGLRELFGIILCTGLYTAVSYAFGWFDRNLLVTLLFAAYIVLSYACIFLVYLIRRRLESKMLNEMLQDYKNRH